MTTLWIILGIIAAVGVGIVVGIKSFESAVKEAIEDLTGRKVS